MKEGYKYCVSLSGEEVDKLIYFHLTNIESLGSKLVTMMKANYNRCLPDIKKIIDKMGKEFTVACYLKNLIDVDQEKGIQRNEG